MNDNLPLSEGSCNCHHPESSEPQPGSDADRQTDIRATSDTSAQTITCLSITDYAVP